MPAPQRPAAQRPAAQRYVVSATLLTCSPLAIHSGMGSEDLQALGLAPEGNFRDASDWNFKPLESCDQLVVRDGAGRPYVPGSSLKGVIREFLTRPGFDGQADTIAWLLGRKCPPAADGAEQDDAQDAGGAGVFEDAFLAPLGDGLGKTKRHLHQASRVWLAWLLGGQPVSEATTAATTAATNFATSGFSATDAFSASSWRAVHERLTFLTDARHLPYWSPQQLSYVEHHVAVDRRTGTASEHKLFTAEAVPAGLPFQAQFIVDCGDAALEAARLLLRALAGFNLDPVDAPIQLGSGTNHGWGRMACLFPTVRVQVWTPAGRQDVTPDELDVLGELKQAKPPTPRKTRVQIRLQLAFDSPFLVNDPAQVCVLEATERKILRSGSDDPKKPPDHVPRVAGVRIVEPECDAAGTVTRPGELWVIPLLPATGFRGPVRSQLERILRTIHPGIAVAPHGELDPVTEDEPGFTRPLFGCEAHESGIWCSEFLATQQKGVRPGKREMVAIDRFTGGASEHAKFDVLCLDRPVLDGVLAFELPPDAAAARRTIGAGILLLRDLIEGDVAFGLGDMKGFGQCRARLLSLAVAGLERLPELARQVQQYTGTRDLTKWLNGVRETLDAEGADERIEQANRLVEVFLAAVREDLTGPGPASQRS